MEKILITGISGEVGFGLVKKLFKLKKYRLVALDIKKPEKEIVSMLHKFYICDISDKTRLNNIFKKEKYFDEVYHVVPARAFAQNNPAAYDPFAPPPEEGTAFDWLHPPLAK